MAITEERVKALMKRRGIENVTDLAQASGVGRSHLYQVWKADGAASLATIRHLARALGVTIGELIGETDPPRTPYHESSDIRALADLLASRPIVARHMLGTLVAILGASEQPATNLVQFPKSGSTERTPPRWSEEFPVEPADFIATGDADYPIELHGWEMEDVEAAAGVIGAHNPENVMGMILNRREVREGRVRSIKVQGDSMSPTLEPGDLVSIDVTRKNPTNEEVTVVYRDVTDGMILGRWEKRGKRVRLLKDNDAFEPVELIDGDIVVGTVKDIIQRPLSPPPKRRKK